jgi:hypothetical protein
MSITTVIAIQIHMKNRKKYKKLKNTFSSG